MLQSEQMIDTYALSMLAEAKSEAFLKIWYEVEAYD